MKTNTITIIGYHLGERIDLKNLKNSLTFDCIYEDQTELVYKPEANSYFQIFDYGSVVFFGIEKTIQTNIINSIRNILDLKSIELMSDNFNVEIDTEAPYKTFFDRIVIKEVTFDVAKMLMLNLAQSVALNFYIEQSNILLAETSRFSVELEEFGKFSLKGKKLLKYFGRTLNLRNKIVNNLYIFDSPQITWNDEFLNLINTDLNRELEINLRYKSLQENLNIVKENLEIFKNLYQHSHSSTLEWIIIILIAVEILNMIIEKIF